MLHWFRDRRRRALLAERFPTDWRDILTRNVPYYAWLPAEKQNRLRDDLRIFIAEREWVGCGGLEITDEIRVTIAAQACMLLLGIPPTYQYERIKSILVYPGPYRKPAPQWGYTGLIPYSEQIVLGEAWHRSPIVLAWQSVLEGAADPHDGNNVVFHEFAHHLDGLDGDMDGTPPLETRAQYADWDAVVSNEFNRLVRADREDAPSFLSYYGATNRAEFFAVASESFFERGAQMRHDLPELYRVLRDFYRQETAAWPEGPPRHSHSKRNASHRHSANGQSDPTDSEETRSLLRLIKLKPGSPDAYFSLGVAYLNESRFKEAEAALSEAVRISPDDEESLLQRGIARMRLGQAAAAKADLDAALEKDPDDPDAYRARAEARLQLRDYAGAIDDCARVLRRERRDATALYLRGLAMGRTGNYSQAIRNLSSAIAANPHRAEFYADRSRLYEMIGSLRRAERDRVEAIRRDPRLADSLSKTVQLGI